MPSTCEIEVRPATAPGGTAVLVLRGEVDGSAKEILPAAYTDAVSTGSPAKVLLDFHAVDYINSTGIAVIVSVLAQARTDRRTVAAAGLTDHYLHIFTITRLVDFMEMVDESTDNPLPAGTTQPA